MAAGMDIVLSSVANQGKPQKDFMKEEWGNNPSPQIFWGQI